MCISVMAKRGCQIPKVGVADIVDHPVWVVESELRSNGRAASALISESSLQPQIYTFNNPFSSWG